METVEANKQLSRGEKMLAVVASNAAASAAAAAASNKKLLGTQVKGKTIIAIKIRSGGKIVDMRTGFWEY